MMQFDVYRNPAPSAGAPPFVVMLSSHYIDLEAVLVAPLIRGRPPVKVAELSVTFSGEKFVLSLITMAAITPSRLRQRLGSLATYELDIRRALDRLFTGF